MPTGELKNLSIHLSFNLIYIAIAYSDTSPAQLVSLSPEELGDWQKPKAAPKKTDTGKKSAEEDEDDENEETAEEGGDEEGFVSGKR